MKKRSLAEPGAWTSIVAYVVLMVAKLVVATVAESSSLWADGLNNATDVFASVAVLVGLRIAGRRGDADGAYGYSRAETRATFVVSFVTMGVGLQVLYGSFDSLLNPARTALPDALAAWTGGVSALIMFAVYGYSRSLAVRTNSLSMGALAANNLSDAIVSIGAVLGILGARAGMPWLDPFAALIIGGIICKTAWDIFMQASDTGKPGVGAGR